MALINCKDCKKEMSNDVKKCPNCGGDQRNWFMKHKFITFIGIFVILVVFMAALSPKDNKQVQSSNASISTNSSEEKKVLSKNGVSSNVEISVLGFESHENLGDNQFTKKKAKGIFKVVKVDLKNNQKDAISVSSASFKLIDDQNREFTSSTEGDMAMSSSIGDNKRETFGFEKINPGMQVSGYISFDVPKDAKDFKLIASGGLTGEKITLKVE